MTGAVKAPGSRYSLSFMVPSLRHAATKASSRSTVTGASVMVKKQAKTPYPPRIASPSTTEMKRLPTYLNEGHVWAMALTLSLPTPLLQNVELIDGGQLQRMNGAECPVDDAAIAGTVAEAKSGHIPENGYVFVPLVRVLFDVPKKCIKSTCHTHRLLQFSLMSLTRAYSS